MAIPSYMRGLLADEDSLLPSAGLLGLAAGNSAPSQMLAAMAQRPTQPSGPVATPRVARGTPSAPMQVEPAKPLISPTSAGLLSGGIAALEAGPGSAYTGPGPVIAAALKAGLSSYVAGKQGEQDAKMKAAQATKFRDMLADPAVQKALGPVEHKFVSSMVPEVGIAHIQKVLEKKREVSVLTPGALLASNEDGSIIARGDPKQPDPENLEPGKDEIAAIEVTKSTDPSSPFYGRNLRPADRTKFTPADWAAVDAKLAEQNKSRAIHVSQEVKSGDKFAEGMGGGAAVIAKERYDNANTLMTSLPILRDAEEALDAGTIRGTGADFRLGLARFLNTTGMTDDETVKNTEVLLGRIAEVALPFAKLLRPFSNTDRDFLVRAKGGDQTWDAQSVRKLFLLQKQFAIEAALQNNDKLNEAGDKLDPAVKSMYSVNLNDYLVDYDGKPTPMIQSGKDHYLFVGGRWKKAKPVP